jgi:hypothetical protein
MFRSDITFPAFLAVSQMASSSRFVDLSEDDIIKFCDEQENKNTTKRMIRDKSLLMPGRGPEEIFMNSKKFS